MKLFREPLFHFLIIGGAIFLLYFFLGNRTSLSPEKIVISSPQIEWLAEGWKRTWHRPPTQDELDGLIHDAVQEEILYQEALKLGLDQDDPIVRRRLRQKMEFLTEDLSEQRQASEKELQEFFQKNSKIFTSDPNISFTQVYLNPEGRSDLNGDAARLLSTLNSSNRDVEASALGDTMALPSQFSNISSTETKQQFGPDFSKSLFEIEPGVWKGPIESGLGMHLVKVTGKEEGKVPEFSQIKDWVKREWLAEQRREFKAEFLQGLSKKYSIEVQFPGWAHAR